MDSQADKEKKKMCWHDWWGLGGYENLPDSEVSLPLHTDRSDRAYNCNWRACVIQTVTKLFVSSIKQAHLQRIGFQHMRSTRRLAADDSDKELFGMGNVDM